MSSISLCMIVKNEEKQLARCLNSVKALVDEIIIVDTGSSDNTVEIAKKFTNKIYHFEWINDFAAARNYSFGLASSDYIMWLDADEVITRNNVNKLLKLKSNLTSDTYMLQNHISFDENNKPTYVYYRERILRNCNNAKWEGCIHECIAPFGVVTRMPISIEHRPISVKDNNRNIKIFQLIMKSRSLTPREQYYYGRELFDHHRYRKAATELSKFLKKGDGWIENNIDACYIMAICYMQLKLYAKAFNILTYSFRYDTPRANICCLIGDYFLLQKEYHLSIYWYKLSISCQDVTNRGGFVAKDYYSYYPYLQLCVAYYNIGDISNAKHYNELAAKVRESDVVKHNREFFNKMFDKNK